MKARRIFETVLYARDLDAAAAFYNDVMGLALVARYDGVMLAFRCGQGLLLIFDPDASRRPGRPRPSHGTEGEGHVAFGAREDEIGDWRRHLEANGVGIERIVSDDEGTCLYFRDPAGNSLEVAPPTLWGGGWFE